MDARQIALNARRASSSPLTIIGHWRRRKAASALLADGGFAAMQALIAALGPPGSKSWSGAERNWLVQEIARRASPEAREAVCTHFLTHADNEFGAMLAAWGHEPEDASRQALLFFLTDQWQRYEEIDPDHSVLAAAYETADPQLRGRLMEQASRHGRQEWVSAAVGDLSGERLGRLSDAEWQTVLQVLTTTPNYSELWRLAQQAPPRWSKRLLDALGEWPLDHVPDGDRANFSHLLEASAACEQDVPKLGALVVCRWHKPLMWPVGPSADGVLTASFHDNRVSVWRLQDGGLLAESSGARKEHMAHSSPLAMTPDGMTVAYNDKTNGLIRVWRVTDGELFEPVERSRFYHLALRPEGRLLVGSGAVERESGIRFHRFWRLRESDLLEFRDAGRVSVLAIDPGGSVLASAGSSVSLWNLRDGTPLRTLISRGARYTDQMQFSPDGTLLATHCAGNISLWRVSDGELLADLHHTASIERFEISSNRELLVSVANGRSVEDPSVIHIWRLPDGKLLAQWKVDEQRDVNFAITPDAKLLFSATCTGRETETGTLLCYGSVKLWRLPDGAPLGTLTNFEHGARKLFISSDGRRLVSCHPESTHLGHAIHPSEPLGIYVWASPLPELSARPIQKLDAEQRRWLQEQLQNPQLTPDERRWLEFTAALIRWRDRYEITFADTPSRSPDEFDIELVTDTAPHKRTRDDD